MSDTWQPGDEPAADVLTVEPRRRSPRTAVVGIACLVGGVALGVAGVASATGQPSIVRQAIDRAQSASPSQSGAPVPAPNAPGRALPFKGRGHQFGKGHGGPLGFGGGGVLHGDFVVRKADGTFLTVHVQRGAVTAVSSTSITVKSDDGFSKSYAVNADTLVNAAREGISTIAKDDVVQMQATGTGTNPTAVSIVDVTKLGNLKEKLRPKRSTSTPAPSASTRPASA